MAQNKNKTIKAPTEELAPVTKGIERSAITRATRIATTAGRWADMLLPGDDVLNRRGGGTVEFYREVLRDDQVKSTFQQRRMGVVSAEWEVEPGAEDAQSKAAAEALAENLKRLRWDRISDRMLFSIFYGYAVGEVMWEHRDGLIQIADIKVRERGRFAFGTKGELLLNVTGMQFEQMPDRKFWVISTGADNDDEPYGLGLAHWLYWPVFFKRNDIKFWLVFLEKFGMPTAMAKLPPGQIDDQATKRRALEVLQSIQVDGGVVVPDGMLIELIEASRSGTADYESMVKVMDAAISKVVLSQTMTTDDGSSQSQATVHQGVADSVVKADSDLKCESFNAGPALWFTELNFPGATPPRVYRRTDPPEDLGEIAERDTKIKQLGFEPTDEYMLETYGPGWVKSQQAEPLIPGSQLPPRGRREEPGDTAADYAEVAALAAIKAANRNDQRALVEASRMFATRKSDDVIGERARQILAYAEEAGDYDTMREHLNELAAEVAPKGAQQSVQRANLVARLMGALRGQR